MRFPEVRDVKSHSFGSQTLSRLKKYTFSDLGRFHINRASNNSRISPRSMSGSSENFKIPATVSHPNELCVHFAVVVA